MGRARLRESDQSNIFVLISHLLAISIRADDCGPLSLVLHRLERVRRDSATPRLRDSATPRLRDSATPLPPRLLIRAARFSGKVEADYAAAGGHAKGRTHLGDGTGPIGKCTGAIAKGTGEFPKVTGEFPDCTVEVPGCTGELLDCTGEVPGCTGEVLDVASELPNVAGEVPDCTGELPVCTGEFCELQGGFRGFPAENGVFPVAFRFPSTAFQSARLLPSAATDAIFRPTRRAA